MIPLRKVNEVPVTLKPKAIETAVASFIQDSHSTDVPLNSDGLFNQLVENIASVCIFKTSGRFVWIAEDNGEVIAFALSHISKDVDNSLCYWMTDAWVAPSWRRRPEVKGWFQQMRQDAVASFCKHIIIPSSRGADAYCRFLGDGWHPYVVLLKQDL